MSNTVHEEQYNILLVESFEHHLHILDNNEISDKDVKLCSLSVIYEKLLEFFNVCNEGEKEKFCIFFCHYLLHPLNKWISEEFDEYRNVALNIYFLIEKNLNDKLLDVILFKTEKNDDSFLLICTNRLKEDENKKIVEDKEEIRLKILQFLYKIVVRHNNIDETTLPNILNIYVYLENILMALSILIKDPFPLIKKLTCELLCELNFEEERKEFNHIYRSLLKNMLANIIFRQNDVRELILKCLKKLMRFESNRDFLNDSSECLKKLCTNKSSNVVLEIANCVEVWSLNIKDLNDCEKAKLVFIILLCINSNVSSYLNERCYQVLQKITHLSKELKDDQREVCISENEYFGKLIYSEDLEMGKHGGGKKKVSSRIINDDEEKTHISIRNELSNQKDDLKKKDACFEKGEIKTHKQFFANMNKLFYVPPSFHNTLCSDIHPLFGSIKKELFCEIMNNEKCSWSEGKEEYASIITMFLLYTSYDVFYFIKHIISFVYKSISLFKYIDYPTTPVLIDDLSMRGEEIFQNTLDKYCYEYESLVYLSKFIYLIITCGYLMPIQTFLLEIAQILLGDSNIQNVLTSFYEFNDISSNNMKSGSTNGKIKCKDGSSKVGSNMSKKEYIFLNSNYHKYLQKVYHRGLFEKNNDLLIESENSSSNPFHPPFLSDKEMQDVFSIKRGDEYTCKDKNEEEKKEKMDDINNKAEYSQKFKRAFYKSGNTTLNELDQVESCINNEYCDLSILYENKKIILMMLSQFLAGYYIRKKDLSRRNKLVEEHINFVLFIINENMNYGNIDSFPYILIIIKHLLYLMGKECKNYSNILFHFLIILQSDNRFCSNKDINKLIEKIEYYSEKKRFNFYNYEYTYFIQNAQSNIIDFNDFHNFKYNINILHILLCNISEEVIMEKSTYLMNFIATVNHELKPLIKSEFLLFLNLFCSKNLFPTFFFKNSHDILKNVLLPLCTWRSGLNEAQTRKGALFCIKTMFVKKLVHENIFQQNNALIESLVCVVKSTIDDTWNNDNREIGIQIYGQIAKNINNNNILLVILNTLIKLLDDTNKPIRKCSAVAMYGLFQNKSLILPDDSCEHIFPILLLHMDDDCSNFSKTIYQILSIAKNFNNAIFLKHAKDSSENTIHAKSYKEELMR
ncbi:conserved Plasmodium protein, unknown function [Plasmodium malariae]|uniref:Dynein axonemal assembly factor 5 TPR repeats domain-containing protein n=1 Tax=Plasmodium malariae TaxID=5858 RepID=A0A1D3PBK2_PLAMA|nr:conserved Plasmodium protein, unknown function [Plasmodium malariae]SCN12649.1 conserved Plasmodium protein, unknown function [Plasmodium malariae]